MQLVLNSFGLSLKSRSGAFQVSDGKQYRKVAPSMIDSIAVLSPCLISSSAIGLAVKEGIPIYFFDQRGEAMASMRSPYFSSIATLRRLQVYFSDQRVGAQWVIDQFKVKTYFQCMLLEKMAKRRRRIQTDLKEIAAELVESLERIPGAEEAPSAEWGSRLMGWEGALAKKYWSALSLVVPPPWTFESRSRRPARDPFNATVNYLYAFLYSIVEQAIFHAGLDPHLGILHADEYDRPTLAYDLIEPFRPWVDELVVSRLLSDQVEQQWYEITENGVFLNAAGKQFWIPAYNEWMEQAIRWEGRQMKRKAHIFRRADDLAAHIRKQVKRPV